MPDRTSSQLLAQQPQHLSFSALNSLTTCGEKFRLERGLKIQTQPSWAQVGGSAVHAASEAYDRNGGPSGPGGWDFESHFEEATVDQEERSGYDRKDFRATGRASKQYPNKEDRNWWLENGPVFVNNWVTWRQMCPWELFEHNGTPGIELELNPTLGGKRVKMFVDRLFALPSGELMVLDLKTGASTPAGSFQLGVYKVGLEELLGVPVTYGCYWLARTNATSDPEDLARYDQAYLDETFWRMSRIVEEGLFLPNEDKHCGWCGVSEYCRAAGGAKAHLAQGVSLDLERTTA